MTDRRASMTDGGASMTSDRDSGNLGAVLRGRRGVAGFPGTALWGGAAARGRG